MADKQIVVPMDFNLKEAKEFVFHNEASAQPNAASTLGQVYYNQALKRVLYTSISDTAGTQKRWVRIPRVDGTENVSSLWTFTRAATLGAPFAVVSDVMVENLTANKLGTGKWLAQLAVGADVIPVRTKKTGTQGTEYDGQILVPLTPIEPEHAASRYFVEQLLHGNVEKPACRVASTRNLAADFDATAGTLTSTTNAFINTSGIDGVTDLAVGDRVLILGQGHTGVLSILGSDNAANGIYTVSELGEVGNSKWVLTRAPDMDSDTDVQDGASVFVAQGTNLAQTQWSLITHRPIDLNTDALQFTRTSGTRTAHTHPAGEITTGTFRDTQAYTFRGALIVGASYFSSGTGIFFGESVSSNNDAARIIQVGGTRTLQIRGNPIGTQALLNLNSTGTSVADPSIKAVKNHSTDCGEITFDENSTDFTKPISPPIDPPAATGTLSRTRTGSSRNYRHIPYWQTSGGSGGAYGHWVGRKFVGDIAPDGSLGTDSNPFPIDHNLGTREVIVQVRRVNDYKEVIVETKPINDNRVTISFGIAPADGSVAYKVIVMG